MAERAEEVDSSSTSGVPEWLVRSIDLVRKLISQKQCSELQEVMKLLIQGKRELTRDGVLEQSELSSTPWKKLTKQGAFATVYQANYAGQRVAVKVLNKDSLPKLSLEGKLLKELRHDHVVEFRGRGRTDAEFLDDKKHKIPVGRHFFVMEFVPSNLERYVKKRTNPEKHGLANVDVWNFGEQILSGLTYLHTRKPPIAHMDLKPDNLLIDEKQMNPRVKLADFGLAMESTQNGQSRSYRGHRLWKAPENWHNKIPMEQLPENALLRSDVYSYGLVLLFLITGRKPWSSQPIYLTTGTSFRSSTAGSSSCHNRSSADDDEDDEEREEEEDVEMPQGNRYEIPSNLPDQLTQIIKKSFCEDPSERSPAPILYTKEFEGGNTKNPFDVEQISAEYFTCGFLKTEIFVADSCVTESTEGSYRTSCVAVGYPHPSLRCFVEIKRIGEDDFHPVTFIPEQWLHEGQYTEFYANFLEMSFKGEIDNNPSIGLKQLRLPRAGEDEQQQIILEFAQTNYCVHRAMREVWMKVLATDEKHEAVPAKGIVNPTFSNSFGLHVAVITADRKFIFARRATRKGLASPGNFTCGAVESCSVKDYESDTGSETTTISLVKTAARGLDEELGVHLEGDDLEAITLATIYLKHDTHEWGLCGFVDLNDERIDPERRLTAEQIKTRFTSAGSKDKFEHERIVAVEFTLPSMVKFVRENHRNFASSAKLVVVKVLQSFFGHAAVEREFKVDEGLLDE
eukprot:m.839 g.839  ORF g.839 m.839 type:complete len:739 (+) comp4988_c0_seq1:46-2262(+)